VAERTAVPYDEPAAPRRRAARGGAGGGAR
jgi:hypothetical protein